MTLHLPPISSPRRDRAELLRAAAQEMDRKTKPLGALGRIEKLAVRLAAIQGRLDPRLDRAEVMVFAADHGIANEGVSAYPQAVTAQMVANFLAGGAAISVLARQLGARMTVVDAGVATPTPPHPQLLDRRIGAGTASFLHGPAMSMDQAQAALHAGIALGQALEADVLLLGEMGIGNTSSAAALMHALTDLPLTACVGRGTGLDDAGLIRKRQVLTEAFAHWRGERDPMAVLAWFGGFEIAMMAGALLGAASRQKVVVIDGFICTAAAAIAQTLAPASLEYAVFSHVSAEAPHAAWLYQLRAQPVLDLDLRLGEGSGAALVLPLLQAAAALLAEMATFEGAGVSTRSDADQRQDPAA